MGDMQAERRSEEPAHSLLGNPGCLRKSRPDGEKPTLIRALLFSSDEMSPALFIRSEGQLHHLETPLLDAGSTEAAVRSAENTLL